MIVHCSGILCLKPLSVSLKWDTQHSTPNFLYFTVMILIHLPVYDPLWIVRTCIKWASVTLCVPVCDRLDSAWRK